MLLLLRDFDLILCFPIFYFYCFICFYFIFFTIFNANFSFVFIFIEEYILPKEPSPNFFIGLYLLKNVLFVIVSLIL